MGTIAGSPSRDLEPSKVVAEKNCDSGRDSSFCHVNPHDNHGDADTNIQSWTMSEIAKEEGEELKVSNENNEGKDCGQPKSRGEDPFGFEKRQSKIRIYNGRQLKCSDGRDRPWGSESGGKERSSGAENPRFIRNEVKVHPTGCGTTCSTQNFPPSMLLEKKLFGGNVNFGWERERFVGCCGNCRPCDRFHPEATAIFDYCRPLRSQSTPDFSKALFRECLNTSGIRKEQRKAKRSLRLIGFQPSNSVTICTSGEEIASVRKPGGRSPKVSAKTFGRSISLGSWREAAPTDDLLDDSNRRLLAQVAYEEWYFKKEKELRRKRQEEKTRKMLERDNSRSDFERKKMRADEEYAKWLKRKRGRRRGDTSAEKLEFIKSKDEVEKAFLEWKKGKDIELEKRRRERREDEKKKVESERQKSEKRAVAEKAFQQWTRKLEEIRRAKQQERIRRKKEQTAEADRKHKGDHDRNRVSFQIWKANKDVELKRKTNRIREAARRIEEERQAQAEERMYEAEQAFHDWLEKVDSRKKRQYSDIHSFQKTTPWLPV